MISFTCAIVVSSIRFGMQLITPDLITTVILGAAAASLLTSSIAVVISSYVAVARSAQQIPAMASMLLVVGTASALERLKESNIALMLRVDLAVIAVALGILFVSARLFRRDSIFE